MAVKILEYFRKKASIKHYIGFTPTLYGRNVVFFNVHCIGYCSPVHVYINATGSCYLD